MMDDEEQPVSVIAVGDMMFDTRLGPPRVFFYERESAACVPHFHQSFPLAFINVDESREWLEQQGVSLDGIVKTSHVAQSTSLKLPADAQNPDFPFRLIRSELMRSDFVFGNLECPLSTRGRPVRNDACYSAHPELAQAMSASNFKVLSFANNHCMDYGEAAFLDTLKALRGNGLRVAGAGADYTEACQPALLEIRGRRLAFFAYNMMGPDIVYALPDESGVIPLNELTLRHTIGEVRSRVDFIFASVHWGVEGVGRQGAELVSLAHQLIDYGADVILGHHSHVPGGIEVYKSKPIFYSLGNFIFGHTHRNWTDNMMIKLVLDRERVKKIEVLPVGSLGLEQFQPVLSTGKRATDVIKFVEIMSRPFGTSIIADEGRGIIEL
jgi:poly-gamma-glutamate capsule biosynthesis protein CapA/YwtB (metallophosphatase superfamily)